MIFESDSALLGPIRPAPFCEFPNGCLIQFELSHGCVSKIYIFMQSEYSQSMNGMPITYFELDSNAIDVDMLTNVFNYMISNISALPLLHVITRSSGLSVNKCLSFWQPV